MPCASIRLPSASWRSAKLLLFMAVNGCPLAENGDFLPGHDLQLSVAGGDTLE